MASYTSFFIVLCAGIMTDINVFLDAVGLDCPLPLLKTKQALNRMTCGEVLEVLATDVGSVKDFEVFAKQSGHILLLSEDNVGTYRYLFKKK
jgi:tRNA 2-thiouridine synthesizing protein A